MKVVTKNIQKKISIVIIAYNASETVTATLDSLLEQSRIPDEIVFVDDSSSDMTSKVANIWNEKYGRLPFKLVRNEINLGAAASRNVGVKSSSGDLVIFCDSDDVMLHERIESHERALGNASVSYVSSLKTYPNEYETWHVNSDFEGLLDFNFAVKKFILGETSELEIFVPSCTLAVRKREFLSIGGFDSTFERLEDVDFALRASRAGFHFSFDQKVLVNRGATSGSHKSRRIEALAQEKLLYRYREFLNEAELREISAWLVVRKKYFANERFGLAFALARYLLTSRNPLIRFRAAMARLKHDRLMGRK